jgi:hypothetical protein
MRQLVDDGLGDAPTRCRFLTPMDFPDRIEAMVHSPPTRERERQHCPAMSLALFPTPQPAPLAACHRDVATLSTHAIHEKLIINPGCFLETFLDRG